MRSIGIYIAFVLGLVGLNGAAEARSVSSLFKQVSPSVVVIQVVQSGYSEESPGEKIAKGGLGSGFVFSEDGLVMTASHVVHLADSVQVTFVDGTYATARVVASSPLADVALVQLDSAPPGMVAAKLGDSDRVDVGDQVFVVGAPYGITHTLTVGHVSGMRRSENTSDQFVPLEFIQTDAAVNQGNSGGPLFNMQGEVIGIVSRILSQSGGFEGIGFAASINVAKELLLKQKSFWTGLEVFLVSGRLAKALNVPQEAGLLVQRVAKNSPADNVGLRAGNIPIKIQDKGILIGGDVVLEVQGMQITTDINQLRLIREKVLSTPGLEEIEFVILREGKTQTLCLCK
jgi:S1-C subfamily serine protease